MINSVFRHDIKPETKIAHNSWQCRTLRRKHTDRNSNSKLISIICFWFKKSICGSAKFETNGNTLVFISLVSINAETSIDDFTSFNFLD